MGEFASDLEDLPSREAVFTSEYWLPRDPETYGPNKYQFLHSFPNINGSKNRIARQIFLDGVFQAMADEGFGSAYPPGELITANSFNEGTLLLFDLEKFDTEPLKPDCYPWQDVIQENYTYPGHVESLLNCSARDLIRERSRRESYRYHGKNLGPGEVVAIKDLGSQFLYYQRYTWFALVVDMGREKGLVSYRTLPREDGFSTGSKHLHQTTSRLAYERNHWQVGLTHGSSYPDEKQGPEKHKRLRSLEFFSDTGWREALEIDRQAHKLGTRTLRLVKRFNPL